MHSWLLQLFLDSGCWQLHDRWSIDSVYFKREWSLFCKHICTAFPKTVKPSLVHKYDRFQQHPSQAKAPHLIIGNITNLRHKLITSNNLKLIHNLTLASQLKRQMYHTSNQLMCSECILQEIEQIKRIQHTSPIWPPRI
jgi:hypothetical protein